VFAIDRTLAVADHHLQPEGNELGVLDLAEIADAGLHHLQLDPRGVTAGAQAAPPRNGNMDLPLGHVAASGLTGAVVNGVPGSVDCSMISQMLGYC
jgi:hypothetical protein